MKGITPFLWFDGKAEEAVKFYTSVFKSSKVGSVARYGEEGPGRRERSDRDVRARRSAVHRFEWRAAVQVHPGHLVRRELREPAGGGRAVGEALGGRIDAAVRLAHGQVRGVLADRPDGAGASCRTRIR